LTRAALERIDRLNGTLNAFLTVTKDLALLQARQADARLARGEQGALLGIPMALKDILSTRGVRTTCGSRILENYIPQYSSTVVDHLQRAGTVLLGKTNMDEFAMGSSNENSAFGPVRNPWDLNRVPGGSSGGSATAVAAGMAVFALGTDTGGSVRQPAALTGTVGLKTTYGRVSRFGVIAFGSSLDQIGPLTRCVKDAATVLDCIAGWDPKDSTSIQDGLTVGSAGSTYRDALTGSIEGMRLGIPREYFAEGMSPAVADTIHVAIDTMRRMGALVEEVSLPHTEYGISTYYVVAPAEAMANLARYDGVRQGLSVRGDDVWEMFDRTRGEGFGPEVKRRVLLGAYALSAGYYDAYYLQAQKVRTLVTQDFDRAFQRVDALIAPTSPTIAFPIGERSSDPLAMYLSDVYTVPASIAGITAVSVPAGFVDGLPVGLQVLGKPLDEATVLRVADAFERSANVASRRPPIDFESAA
jgi:aspartyl-tRNA(Asn)/glutamyl-tRNA(Gln) amidotransferase subunit A